MRSSDGTVHQSGLQRYARDYMPERLYYPVVGIVTAVHFSDDPQNTTAKAHTDQRGSAVTCDVIVVGDGTPNPWLLPNVVVLPEGPSGVDDFCESIPRPASQMTDGSAFDSSLSNIDYEKLDGDWCVVAFIGGSVEQPVMMKWWPHPGNRQDPATAGFPIQTPSQGQTQSNTLDQGRRYFRRFAGARFTITEQGSVFIDTNQSNNELKGSSSGVQRTPSDDGGDVQLDVKPARQLQVNFNPSVPLPKTQPSLPQPNPPQGEQMRATDRTTVTLDKDTVSMLAGKIVELLTSDDYIDLHAKTKVRLRGDDADDTVILGDDDPANCDHTVKGETFRILFNALIDAFNSHTHGTPVGPSGPPMTPFGETMDDTQLSLFVMVKK